jgi:hypothetical protein
VGFSNLQFLTSDAVSFGFNLYSTGFLLHIPLFLSIGNVHFKVQEMQGQFDSLLLASATLNDSTIKIICYYVVALSLALIDKSFLL